MISTPLQNLKLKNIIKFADDNNFGKDIEITYRQNPITNPAEKVEPHSIEIRYTSKSGSTKGIVFSSHGVANIFDGKRYAYPTDNEERFSKDNCEFHALTLAWTKMVANECESESQIKSEIEYRNRIYAKVDQTRSEVGALKSYYKNQYATLEDNGQQNTRLGIKTKQLLDDYIKIAENLSAYKSLQTKCRKILEHRLEEIRVQE